MTAETARRPSPIASRRLALIALAAIAATAALPTSRPHAPTESIALRIDPNTAPAPVLEALPRIGPVMAGRLVAAREIRPFADLDDLDRRVPGVGPVTRDALRPFFRFESDTEAQPKDR
jgi:competence protein ComEA